MKWSLIELQKYRNEPLIFSETVELKQSLMERDSEILDVSPIKIDGTLIVEKEEVIARLVISLVLTMPSARSLKPVPVPMLIEANEVYVPKSVRDFDANDREETVIYLDKDLIDLTDAIEDTILLNLPLQVFTKEEETEDDMPSGNGWEVVSEEEYVSRLEEQKSQSVDPRLAGLADLFTDNTDNDQ
ncbi:YceD family protein [Carnobacterium gallinarum]|uniref:YceD family protein n=1 Tax=Carnobacterium gallinarum TaxID=2749 RepID=UPI00054D6165|nr:YceD family protein [Carnobacterium gallinarum]